MDQLERNKEVVVRAWQAFDRGDEAAFVACFSEGWREYHPSGEPATLDDARASMRVQRTAFPDKHTTIDRIIAEGDLVVTHSRSEATHTGVYFGVAPSGRRVMIHEMLINRLVDGRIVESWQITSGGFLDQLTGH
jgi:predicted ester cyclase